MTTVNISGLTAGTPAATGVFEFQHDPGGAGDENKKIAYSDLASAIVATVATASDTVAGKVELAIASEINTGSDATRAVTPDALAGSNLGTKNVQIVAIAPATLLTTGDNKAVFVVPPELNGMNLVDADAALTTVVATGATLVNISLYNLTDSQDMLSTPITIDASEFTSFTAATQPVINATYDDVATGDRISINIDAVGNTTAGTGLNVLLSFRLP